MAALLAITESLHLGDVILRIMAAAAAGAVIGIEREWRGQPAGVRTHVVLAIGACLAMILGLEIAKHSVPSDPQRIPAQVISGIGFLGAGAILVVGLNIHGLTTATSLWTTSVIGLVCGNAFYMIAAFATCILLVVLTLLRVLEHAAFGYREVKEFVIVAESQPDLLPRIVKIFDEHELWIDHLGVQHDLETNELEVTGYIRIGSMKFLQALLIDIRNVSEIKRCKIK